MLNQSEIINKTFDIPKIRFNKIFGGWINAVEYAKNSGISSYKLKK